MVKKTISKKGITLIARWEGLVLKPYNCPAGYATIGLGHLIGKRRVNNSDREQYKNFSVQDAHELFHKDVVIYEDAVNNAINVPITQEMFDACVSLCYNIGGRAFSRSSVVRHINAYNYGLSADSFLLWKKAGGKVLQGLVKRRRAERLLFLEGCANG